MVSFEDLPFEIRRRIFKHKTQLAFRERIGKLSKVITFSPRILQYNNKGEYHYSIKSSSKGTKWSYRYILGLNLFHCAYKMINTCEYGGKHVSIVQLWCRFSLPEGVSFPRFTTYAMGCDCDIIGNIIDLYRW